MIMILSFPTKVPLDLVTLLAQFIPDVRDYLGSRVDAYAVLQLQKCQCLVENDNVMT